MITSRLWDSQVFIRPMVFTAGGVPGCETIGPITASKCGLNDTSNSGIPPELVQFLEPQKGNVSKRWFDGFYIRWVVCPTKIYFLLGRQVNDLHRGGRVLEFIVQS